MSTASSFAPPPRPKHPFRRAAILFAGGPAPAANAVISTCATSFLRAGTEVLGMLRGYSGLVQYGPDRPMRLKEGSHDGDYIRIDHPMLRRTRNSQGILIGTARTNPGKAVTSPADLEDAQKVAPLRRVYDGLRSLEVDCLISIGGDDTLTSANKFKLFQDRLPAGSKRIPVVHLPKTIDNDLFGIDFTFGYFTAVDQLGTEILNLMHDAEASGSYYLAETMGRSAGWLAYGAAIAGEASLVLSVEDIQGKYRTTEEYVDERDGHKKTREMMDLPAVLNRLVQMILDREQEGKHYGVLVLAEGLAELLPYEHLKGIDRDEHDHIAIPQVNLGRKFAKWVADTYKAKTGRGRKITGVQFGYEARCAKPHAFDVMLGCQLGVGGYRALAQQGLDGVMVAVEGQLNLVYRKFEELVDPKTLRTKVRNINIDADFHTLARFLETYGQHVTPKEAS